MVAGELVELANVSPTPCESFRVSPYLWAGLLARAELVLHSHPGGEAWPSLDDQAQALAGGVPWYVKPRGGRGFTFGPGLPRLPLVGRVYRSGVTDCYALLRDALAALHGIKVRDYPRAWDFWRTGERLFETRIEAEGFERVGCRLAEARPGDVLLFRIRATVANHCGLVIERGEMLHHPAGTRPYDPTHVSAPVSVARFCAIPLEVWRYA